MPQYLKYLYLLGAICIIVAAVAILKAEKQEDMGVFTKERTKVMAWCIMIAVMLLIAAIFSILRT